LKMHWIRTYAKPDSSIRICFSTRTKMKEHNASESMHLLLMLRRKPASADFQVLLERLSGRILRNPLRSDPRFSNFKGVTPGNSDLVKH